MNVLFLTAKFRLQILDIYLALAAEKWSNGDPIWVKRGEDGKFGTQNGSDKPNPQDVLNEINNFLNDSKKFETVKDNTYQALGIENPDIIEYSFMTGYGSPDIIQQLVFGGLSQIAGLSAKQAKGLVEDITKNPEASVKEALSKYNGIANSPPAQISTKIIETYLDHKKKLSNCIGYGSEITEKDFATQVGCLNSFAMETVIKAAPYLGVAILPELTGSAVAGGTLESMVARIAQEIPKKVVVGLKLNEEVSQIQEEKMGEKGIALTTGLLVGGALKEAQNTAKENPEAYTRIQNTIADIKPAIEKMDDLADAVNTAIKDIDTQDIEKALNSLPVKYQETIQGLAGSTN